jgi:phosphopantothenoylcysteine synthetase/decarboxylase
MPSKIVFLIFSGPTKEYIDPVRFVSNESSGKMGKALAESAFERGHDVIFISGPVNEYPANVKLIKVTTALEMFKEVKLNLKEVNVVIGVAAVADYRSAKIYKHKIKKNKMSRRICLKENPDIIEYCAKKKHKQVTCGFALETRNMLSNAREKLRKKNLNMILVNGKEAFGSDKASVYLVKEKKVVEMKNKNKPYIAGIIIDELVKIYGDTRAG